MFSSLLRRRWRKSSATSILILILLLNGCSREEDNGPPSSEIRQLWPRGSFPVPSPADARFLFVQEESPAGLYVLQDNSATILNPSGPESRTDYTWSFDGRRIAFSSPGSPGSAQTGIWISDADVLSSLSRIWDRGSHPRFYPVETLLVCAGPEDGSDDEGVWQMDFLGGSRQRLASAGVDPEISPDGAKIAYLITTGGSIGRTLLVYHRAGMTRDTVAVLVLRHAWLADSQTLVYETMQNGAQEINLVGPNDDVLGITIAFGTSPSGMSNSTEFIFAGISGDRLNGIYRAARDQSPIQISTVGANPRHAGGNRVVAQDSTGIIEIVF